MANAKAVKIPPVRLKVIPPPCLGCGRPLRPYPHRKEAYLRSAAKNRKKAARDEFVDHYYLRLAIADEAAAAKADTSEQWGGYGDNYFCGVNCGYRWALCQVRRLATHGNWTLPSLEKMREGVRR